MKTQTTLTRQQIKEFPYDQRYQLLLEHIEQMYTLLDEAEKEAGFYRRQNKQLRAKENYYNKPYSGRMTA